MKPQLLTNNCQKYLGELKNKAIIAFIPAIFSLLFTTFWFRCLFENTGFSDLIQ